MSSLLRPVGSASAGTYWRRRVFVVAIAAVLTYVAVRACTGDSPGSDPASSAAELQNGNRPTASSSPTSEESTSSDNVESPAESSPAEPGDGATTQASGGGDGVRPGYCLDENVRLDVRPSKRQYGPTEKAAFTLLFVNVGDAPCRFDVGTATWSIEIMSGQTRIWSSEDCVTEQASDPQTLDRLTPVPVEHTWDRLRSDPECPTGERPAAEPGTYTVTARAGDVVSPEAVFILESGETG